MVENLTLSQQSPKRHNRELHRYTKLSEWVFDLLFRMLLNLGNWITAMAVSLHVGYFRFHQERESFAEQRKIRPPVWVSEQAEFDLTVRAPVATAESS